VLGNKIDTKIYVENPLQYGGANNHEETDPLSTAEYKLQGESIFIGVQERIFQGIFEGIFQIYKRN
jgi:hypothetical protein